MTSQELKRWLTKQGCTFGIQVGSHLKVYYGEKKTILPMHGQKKDLREGLVNTIKASSLFGVGKDGRAQ